jgi:hypothetical protein
MLGKISVGFWLVLPRWPVEISARTSTISTEIFGVLDKCWSSTSNYARTAYLHIHSTNCSLIIQWFHILSTTFLYRTIGLILDSIHLLVCRRQKTITYTIVRIISSLTFLYFKIWSGIPISINFTRVTERMRTSYFRSFLTDILGTSQLYNLFFPQTMTFPADHSGRAV